jgi:hypothetical protein
MNTIARGLKKEEERKEQLQIPLSSLLFGREAAAKIYGRYPIHIRTLFFEESIMEEEEEEEDVVDDDDGDNDDDDGDDDSINT